MEGNWESQGNSLLDQTLQQCKELFSSSEWEHVKDTEGVNIYKTNGPNELLVGKSECQVSKSVSEVISYISEPYNYERWGDRVKKIEVKEEGQDIKLLYLQLKQKWPIEDREILYVEGIRKDEEAEYLLARSIPLDIPVEKKHTRGQLNLNCIKVEDIGNGNSKLSMLIQFHPCGSVPEVGLKNIQTGVVSFLASVKSSLT